MSTTQTIVGALIGVGFASQADIKWAWDMEGASVSQVVASWAIAPLVAAGFAAIIFGILKYSVGTDVRIPCGSISDPSEQVLERRDSFKWAMRLIPLYLAVTAALLALFIVVEAPTAPSLEEFGAGKAAGISEYHCASHTESVLISRTQSLDALLGSLLLRTRSSCPTFTGAW